jgi:DNA-binding transcriptional LysR family regulator
MHISQPTVTKALKDVEEIFMAQLFERTSSGLRATAAGKVALKYAAAALADLQTAAQTLTAIDTGFQANIRMGVIPSAPDALWTTALTQLLDQHPRVSVFVQEGITEDLVAALQTHVLDCAIARSPHQRKDDKIVQEPIYQQIPCVLVATGSYDRLCTGFFDWRKLAQMEWIMQPPNTPMRQAVNLIFSCTGAELPVPIVETFSIKVIETVFRAKPNAITILATDMGDRLIANGVCRKLPYDLNWSLPPICILMPHSIAQRPALQTLASSIRASAIQLELS